MYLTEDRWNNSDSKSNFTRDQHHFATKICKLASHKIDRLSAKQSLFQEGPSLPQRNTGSRDIMIRVGFCMQVAKESPDPIMCRLTHFLHYVITIHQHYGPKDWHYAHGMSATCVGHVTLKTVEKPKIAVLTWFVKSLPAVINFVFNMFFSIMAFLCVVLL